MKVFEIVTYIITVIAIFVARHIQNLLVENLKPEFQNKRLRARMAGMFIPIKWLTKEGEKYITYYFFAFVFTFAMIFISMVLIAYNYF